MTFLLHVGKLSFALKQSAYFSTLPCSLQVRLHYLGQSWGKDRALWADQPKLDMYVAHTLSEMRDYGFDLLILCSV